MKVKISIAFTLLLLLTTYLIPVSSQSPDYDLVIRNGRIVDGSGRAPFQADLGIKGDKILRIGGLPGASAKRTIDAKGQIVAPGFIDMLGQSETFLLIDPRAM